MLYRFWLDDGSVREFDGVPKSYKLNADDRGVVRVPCPDTDQKFIVPMSRIVCVVVSKERHA